MIELLELAASWAYGISVFIAITFMFARVVILKDEEKKRDGRSQLHAYAYITAIILFLSMFLSGEIGKLLIDMFRW